jgi:two-component system chemotaxis sensor kinase CheA
MSDAQTPGLTEFVGAFVAEAEELLALANAQLLAVEEAERKGGFNPRGIREAFRAVHTIKGLAGMVGVEPIVTVSHRMESLLRHAERSGRRFPLAALDTLLDGLRHIQQAVRALAERRPVAEPSLVLLQALDAIDSAAAAVAPTAAVPAPEPRLLDLQDPLLRKLSPGDLAVLQQGLASGSRAVRVDFFPSAERAAQGETITSVREAVGRLAEIVKVLPLSLPPSPEAPTGLGFALLLLVSSADDAALASAARTQVEQVVLLAHPAAAPHVAPTPEQPAAEPPEPASLGEDNEPVHRGVVRVEVARLDDAMERLSAVIVTRYRLSAAEAKLAAQGVDTRELRSVLKENARQLRDLRGAILRVRMIRMTELLERVPLIVRNLRRTTGKKVRLETDAGAAELDKTVAERLFPALIHLVRNAVDHAIEAPAERVRRGKPEEGLLRIRAIERSNTQLEVTITDDGGGIDRERVAARAGKPVPTTDAELLDLICLAGLSTRDEATTTSGRGMGMDIVRRVAVQDLGGELSLVTAAGRGTTFTLRVPLTISIVDAFSFECAAQRFVAPVANIEEIFELEPGQMIRGPGRTAAGTRVGFVERRGEAVPLVRLDALFGRSTGAELHKAMVVRRNGQPVAFMVDRMLGQQEVVVRPLEDQLVKSTGIGGTTDLGDGQPTLVIDLPALADHFMRQPGAQGVA